MLSDFFDWIWKFISDSAMKVWAIIATLLVAVISWFNIATPGWLDDYTTTVPTTTTTATTAEPTTSSTTTTTTMVATTKAPQTWNVDLTTIQAWGLETVSMTVTTQNSFGTVKSYDVVGPKLKDVLERLGADMAAINAGSVVEAKCTDPADPASAAFNYFLITNDDTIVALTVGGSAADVPRLFAAVEPGNVYSDSGKAVKLVDTLILNYN